MKEKTFFRRRKKHAENILNKHCRSTYTYVYCIGSEFNRKANERRQKTPTNDISHRRISFDLGLLIFIHYFIVIKRSALTGIRIHNIFHSYQTYTLFDFESFPQNEKENETHNRNTFMSVFTIIEIIIIDEYGLFVILIATIKANT